MNNVHPIPASFKLRRRMWRVLHEPESRRPINGATYPMPPKRIKLFDKSLARKRTPMEKQKTFWHELTHAVLFEMGHKLARDERFVTRFGLLLEEAIRTARFEETPDVP